MTDQAEQDPLVELVEKHLGFEICGKPGCLVCGTERDCCPTAYGTRHTEGCPA
jgi:hypothetical protein